MKQIIVTIKGKEVNIETEGFTGPLCLKESQFLKEALGEELSQDLKPTFFITNETGTEIKRTLKPLCG